MLQNLQTSQPIQQQLDLQSLPGFSLGGTGKGGKSGNIAVNWLDLQSLPGFKIGGSNLGRSGDLAVNWQQQQ